MGEKLFTYVIILSLMSLLFAVIGAQTAASAVLTAFGITNTGIDYQSSTVAIILAALLTLGITAVFVSFISKFTLESAILIQAGYIGMAIAFTSDFVNIVNYGFMQGVFAGWIGMLILAPLYAGFVITIVQAWRGQD